MFVGPCIIVVTEEKSQLDATYYFIVLLIGSTRFGHYSNLTAPNLQPTEKPGSKRPMW